MKIQRRGRKNPTNLLERSIWSGALYLQRVRELNERCLCNVVAAIRADDRTAVGDVVSRFQSLWNQMTSEACRRIAGVPVLLMDLRFQRPEWWRWITRTGPKPIRLPDTGGHVPISDPASLVREILVEVCVVALSSPRTARIVFGMAPEVIEIIRTLRASEIDAIATRYADELQLRWADNLVYWKNLLSAALSNDEDAVLACHVQTLQLLGN